MEWRTGFRQPLITRLVQLKLHRNTLLLIVLPVVLIYKIDKLLTHFFRIWVSAKAFLNAFHIFDSLCQGFLFPLLIIFIQGAYHPARNACSHRVCWNILGDKRASPDDAIVSDCHTFENHYIRAKINIVPYGHVPRRIDKVMINFPKYKAAPVVGEYLKIHVHVYIVTNCNKARPRDIYSYRPRMAKNTIVANGNALASQPLYVRLTVSAHP